MINGSSFNGVSIVVLLAWHRWKHSTRDSERITALNEMDVKQFSLLFNLTCCHSQLHVKSLPASYAKARLPAINLRMFAFGWRKHRVRRAVRGTCIQCTSV